MTNITHILLAQAAAGPIPAFPGDPGVWAQLGPVGGILAFIVTALWLFREYQWVQREKEWRTTLEKQWDMMTALTRTTSNDLVEVIEKSTTAWTAVKTLLESRLR